MNWFKKFNEDSIKLSRKEFFIKYWLTILIIVFSWASLYNLSILFSTRQTLTHIRGTLNNKEIDLTLKHKFKGSDYVTYNLLLYLNENQNCYIVKNRYDYTNVNSNIYRGDTIDIYTKSFLSKIIWPINNNYVYEIDYNDLVLLSFKDDVRFYYSIMFLIYFGLLLIIIYIRKRMKNKLENSNEREIGGLLNSQ